MAQEIIEAETFGGPEDGVIIRSPRRPYTVFQRMIPGTLAFEESLYALEVLEDGRFRWRHLSTHPVAHTGKS